MWIEGYINTEQIHKGVNSHVYRAVRERDKTPVIIKINAFEYPALNEFDKFCNQYDIVKDLNIEGIIKVYELVNHNSHFAIIMEDIGGTSLRKVLKGKTLDLFTFINLSIKLSQGLQEIHSYNIIHKNITPDNVVVSDGFKEVKIIDFSIATKHLLERQSNFNENILKGNLAYISPEQTGRMNRGIDYRTDFYSLGIMFYELLTGLVPFYAKDVLGLVHLHIASTFPTPHEVNQDIPKALSNIIIKLLSKNAEDRYQSARGLKKDLERVKEQLISMGKIEEFVLAQDDYSENFRISSKLYGRNVEREIFLKIFGKVTDGSSQMLLVSGYSGIGKSALIHEIYKPIVIHKSFFICGKFDQYNKTIPYSAIKQAFDELIYGLLTKSDTELAKWKNLLLDAVGNNGQVIIDLIPLLESVIGKQAEVKKLDPLETHNRFRLLFQRFAAVFAKEGCPLVIFLDDLQWADLASLTLIKNLLTDSNMENFLFLGAYRDNEVNDAHPLILIINEIKNTAIPAVDLKLRPISKTHVNELISDSLEWDKESTKSLAEIVYKKTKGNPFFIDEFLKMLYARKLLKFNHSNRWIWDLDKIRALKVTENVVDLLTEKIIELPHEAKDILKIASCIGSRFTFATLVTVYEKSKKELIGELSSLIEEGFIFFQDNIYFFSHDKVQEAVYSLIPEEIKEKIHYRIGTLVLKNTQKKELEKNIFNIIDQLNMAVNLIQTEEEQIKLARLNLTAGIKAKESTAYHPSLKYLNIGIALVTEKWWRNQYELTVALYKNGAEAAYLSLDFKLMEKLAHEALKNIVNILDKVKIFKIRINAYSSQADFITALKTGIKILKELGVNLPQKTNKKHVLLEIIKTKMVLKDKSITYLQNRSLMTDSRKLGAMSILMSIVSSAYYAFPNIFSIIVLKMLQLTVKYGKSPASSFAYGMYSFVLCGTLGEIESGYQFGELALQTVLGFKAKKYKASVWFCNGFIRHWKVHLKETLPFLLDGYKFGLENGNLEYACNCIHAYLFSLTFTEIRRDKLYKEAIKYLNQVIQLKQDRSINHIKKICQFNLNLIDNNVTEKYRLKGELFDEDKMLPLYLSSNNNTYICIVYIYDLLLCYFFDNYSDAVKNAQKAKKYLSAVQASIYTPIYTFYYSLSLLAVYTNQTKRIQNIYLKQINDNLKQMKHWAEHAPMNNLHKFFLVKAEKARVLEHTQEAMDNYKESINHAGKNEYINEQGLAYERAALFYLNLNQLEFAKLYMRKSKYCYYLWGARKKVNHLESVYYELLSAEPEIRITGNDYSSSSSLDLNTILKASHTISEEFELEKLLRTLMKLILENAGAQCGFIALEQNGSYYIEAEIMIGKDNISVMRSIPIESYTECCFPIVQYVLRTQKIFITGDAIKDKLFKENEYIKEKGIKSLLCFPIIHHTKLIALLYFVNNVAVNAFTEERLKILESLSSQIAISLENARLYNQLEKYDLASSGNTCCHIEKNFNKTVIKNPAYFSAIITKNPKMLKIFKYIEDIGKNNIPVLITGETGTGKELITRAIHTVSRRTGKMITINVAGLDDNLFSDTLFGHKKGAFTGADKERKGLIEQAKGGTIFLDEIGDLSQTSQVKLLRLIQQGQYYPLGSDKEKFTDARIIAATNIDIKLDIEKNKFRKDLYYRLITHHIHLPPLRERLRDDLELLVNYFVNRICKEIKRSIPQVPEDIFFLLKAYNFPGNIRELEEIIKNAVCINQQKTLPVSSFYEYFYNQSNKKTIDLNLENQLIQIITFNGMFPKIAEVKKELIKNALNITNGNQSAASRLLGITQPALSMQLKKMPF